MIVPATDALAVDLASRAISRGDVICLPTDTVYGIGADPFSAEAVTRLLTAKSRTRENPPPVLVANMDQARAVSAELSSGALTLMAELWPGALTIIVPARDGIGWDLGETHGTVALRMPDSQMALELLEETGPLAVTSANQHGQPAASTVEEASRQLGEAVALYVDGGEVGDGRAVASTIVDATDIDAAGLPAIVRAGSVTTADIARALGVSR